LNGNPLLGTEGVVQLRDFIENSTSLVTLNLAHCAIDNRGMRDIASTKFPKTFKELDVSHNMCGARYIARWMENNKGKASIIFSGTNMTTELYMELMLKQD